MQALRPFSNRVGAIALALTMAAAYLLAAPTAEAQRDPNLPTVNAEGIYGRITDQFGRTLRARVELWYPDLDTPVTEELGMEVTGAAIYDRQLFHAGHSDETGFYHLEAIPGTWLVRISKGPEYTIAEFEVVVHEIDGTREMDGQRHDVVLEMLYERWGFDPETRGWYSGDMHHHSLHSDGINTAFDVKVAAVANDLDFLSLTDHNQFTQNEQWLDLIDAEFIPLPGNEVTTSSPLSPEGKGFGHHIAVVDGLPGATRPDDPRIFVRYTFEDAKDLQRAINENRRMGGLWAPTHSAWPVDWPNGTLSSWGEVRRYDAIDVFIGWDVGPHLQTTQANNSFGSSIFGKWQFNMNTMMTQIWFEFLNAGNRLAAWASSDSHNTIRGGGVVGPTFWRNSTGNARVYVNAIEKSEGAIKTALKRGNAFVTSGYWGPLLLVKSRNKIPGQKVQVGSDHRIPLDIKVLSNRPLQGYENGIRIINNGKIVQEIDTRPNQGAYVVDIKTTVEVQPVDNGMHGDGWIVVEAFGQWPSMAMTNAIYLDFEPYGRWGSQGWQFPPGASSWFNEFSDIGPNPGCKLNVPDVTVPDGPAQSPWSTLPAVTECDFFVLR